MKYFVILSFVLVTLFSSAKQLATDTTVTTSAENTTEIVETEKKENPGVLFWVACITAGTMPWIFIYYMKKKKRW